MTINDQLRKELMRQYAKIIETYVNNPKWSYSNVAAYLDVHPDTVEMAIKKLYHSPSGPTTLIKMPSRPCQCHTEAVYYFINPEQQETDYARILTHQN